MIFAIKEKSIILTHTLFGYCYMYIYVATQAMAGFVVQGHISVLFVR